MKNKGFCGIILPVLKGSGCVKDFNIPTVNLSLDTLIRECSKKTRPGEDIFADLSLWNRENIHEIFRYRKFKYDFIDYVTCFNDGESVIGYIRPSYDDFLIKLCRILGLSVGKEIKDDNSLTEKLMARVERLKQIQSERELRKEFPVLYDDLTQGRGFINDVEQMPKKTEEEKKRYDSLRHYYYSCGLKQRIDRFIKTQGELYTRYVTRRHEYKELISKKSINRFFGQNFDMDKVALYTIHLYLYRCEHATSEEEYEQYMSYVEKYLKSDYDKNVAIQTKNGYIVNQTTIMMRINALRKKHAKKEVLAGWELVPEGKLPKTVKQEGTPRTITMTEKDVDVLRQVGRQKQEFYESTPYMARVIGLEQYRGYVGYIYPNGQVLLDREFNEDAPSSAKGNAIYNMKVRDFEALSRMDKTTLRNNPRVGRIYHSKHWEEKAREVIDRQADLLDHEEAVQLIKRLKQK